MIAIVRGGRVQCSGDSESAPHKPPTCPDCGKRIVQVVTQTGETIPVDNALGAIRENELFDSKIMRAHASDRRCPRSPWNTKQARARGHRSGVQSMLRHSGQTEWTFYVYAWKGERGGWDVHAYANKRETQAGFLGLYTGHGNSWQAARCAAIKAARADLHAAASRDE